MTKDKIILAILFIAATLGIGFALYFFFFKSAPTIPTTPPQNTTETSNLPESSENNGIKNNGENNQGKTGDTSLPFSETAQGGATKTKLVTASSAKGLTINDKGSLQYYDANNGTFYTLDANGNPKALTDDKFFNVQQIAWSPDAKKVAMEFPDSYNIIYDLETKKQVTLPTHWSNFNFSADGNKIAAISKGINENQNWLLTINSDGTQAKGIEPLGKNADKIEIAWNPGAEVVGFSKTGDPAGGESQEIFVLGQNGENNKSLIVDGYGFKPKWFPDGKQLMYTTYSSRNDYKPVLWVVDANGSKVGGNAREIKVNTWIQKCTTVDDANIICAVPNEMPKGAGFSPKVTENIPDTFYKIDTRSGTKTLLAIPETATNAEELQVSADGKELYYKNILGNVVEKIQLK